MIKTDSLLKCAFLCAASVSLAHAAESTPVPAAPVAKPAVAVVPVPEAFRGAWVIAIPETLSAAKALPKWKPEDEKMFSSMAMRYGTLELDLGEFALETRQGGRSHGKAPVSVKRVAADVLELEVTPPAGTPGQPSALAVTRLDGGMVRFKTPGFNDFDHVVWKKRPSDWKPGSETDAFLAGLAAAASDSAPATPAPAAAK